MANGRAIAAAQARRYFRRRADQQTFMRQMADEAHFEDLTSPAGAQGPAQIMPATARSWGVRNVHDPEQAFAAAASHMAAYLRAYHGSWRDALTAYNAGPGAVGGPLPAETRNYISTILGGRGDATAGATNSAAAAQPADQRVQLGQRQTFDQAGYDAAQKRFVLANLLAKKGTDSPLFKTGLLSLTAPDRGAFTSSRLTSKVVGGGSTAGGSRGASSHAGVATFDGKPIAAWMKPLLDYARQRGWKGTVNSGVRTDAEQTRIYQSGTRPAAVPKSMGGAGSKHEQTGYLQGAIDVSDAATLDAILRRKHSRLKYAGAKDPVHFSVPMGGSY